VERVQVSMLVVPVPAAIRLGDSVAYPIAGVHCWPSLLYRSARRHLLHDWKGSLFSVIDVLDQDFFDLIRNGCGLRSCDAVSIRN
jgi:hypothetical protein